MSAAPFLRLTIALAHRNGSEVLLHDSGPLDDIAAVRAALEALNTAFDRHADLVLDRGGDLLMRIGERRYQLGEKPTPAWPKRAASGVRF
jgi:hypothetical protein